MSLIRPMRRLSLLVGLLGFMALAPGRAHALTAGTGTVNVTVVINPITQAGTLTIAATFANATYDLGVNLGPVGTISAQTVAVTNLNLATGASFVIPFKNTGNSFDALGDIACPSGGCAAPATGPYGFVGFLDNINVSALPAGNTYTFDGSVTCTLNGITLTCNGPFVLNAFPNDAVGTGNPTINRSVTFRDPTTGTTRSFNARVTLNGVTSGGPLNISGLSRYRGTIPAGYALSNSPGNFRALFFDVATDAVFTSGRVCVEVDVSPMDGIVDGTSPPLTLNQLAILHASSAGNPFAAVPLILTIPGFVCADALTSLSPFVLLVDTTPPTTTTTVTTIPAPTTTTTTFAHGNDHDDDLAGADDDVDLPARRDDDVHGHPAPRLHDDRHRPGAHDHQHVAAAALPDRTRLPRRGDGNADLQRDHQSEAAEDDHEADHRRGRQAGQGRERDLVEEGRALPEAGEGGDHGDRHQGGCLHQEEEGGDLGGMP